MNTHEADERQRRNREQAGYAAFLTTVGTAVLCLLLHFVDSAIAAACMSAAFPVLAGAGVFVLMLIRNAWFHRADLRNASERSRLKAQRLSGLFFSVGMGTFEFFKDQFHFLGNGSDSTVINLAWAFAYTLFFFAITMVVGWNHLPNRLLTAPKFTSKEAVGSRTGTEHDAHNND